MVIERDSKSIAWTGWFYTLHMGNLSTSSTLKTIKFNLYFLKSTLNVYFFPILFMMVNLSVLKSNYFSKIMRHVGH